MKILTETYSKEIEKVADFVAQHMDDDVTNLVLNRGKWPEVDMDLAVNSIQSRRKLKNKVPEWFAEQGLVFPLKLSAEQCSGSLAGMYKSELAARIAEGRDENAEAEIGCYTDRKSRSKERGWRLADLTGGLGVDSWFFSQKASQVLYCEMKEQLCNAAVHNFNVLAQSGKGGENILVCNCCVISENDAEVAGKQIAESTEDVAGMRISASEDKKHMKKLGRSEELFATPSEILKDFAPDIVYADPARRSESGQKVFLIEDCTPDILTLRNEIFRYSRHILIKLSPMADISMVCSRLGETCREVHIVSVNDECKELLIWMDREWSGKCTISAVELKKHHQKKSQYTFKPEEEKNTAAVIASEGELGKYMESEGEPIYLFEPGSSLMKAGAFNLIGRETGLSKLGISTHYYIGKVSTMLQDKSSADLTELGKVFRIIRMYHLDKKSLKQVGADFPGAGVTARNLPADTETYRKKMKISPKGISGLNKHIFCLKSDKAGALLIVGERIL